MMYQARRLPFSKPYLLRSIQRGNTPAAQTQSVINENNKRIKAYNLLLNSRKLWEQSENPVNKGAFKVVPATRDVPDKVKREVPYKFADFEAPEQALTKREENAIKPWKYGYLNTRDLPEFDNDKPWSAPEDLLPGREEVLDFEEDDETELKLQEEEEEEDDVDVIIEKQREYDLARQKSKYARKIMSGEIYEEAEEDAVFKNRDERLHQMEESKYKPTYISGTQAQEAFVSKMHEEELEEEAVTPGEENAKIEQEEDEENFGEEEDEGEDLTPTQKKRKCLMCGHKAPKVHPMNVYLLSRFVSPHGDIFPRTVTGACMRHQRDIGRMFRSMKGSGLINFKKGFTIHIPFEPPLEEDDVDKEQEAINKHLVAMGYKDADATEADAAEQHAERLQVTAAEDLGEDLGEFDDIEYEPDAYSGEFDTEYTEVVPEDLDRVVEGGRNNIPHRKPFLAPRKSPYEADESEADAAQRTGLARAKGSSQEWRKKRPEKGVVPMNQRSKRNKDDRRHAGGDE